MAVETFKVRAIKHGNGLRINLPAKVIKNIKCPIEMVTISHEIIFENGIKKHRFILDS